MLNRNPAQSFIRNLIRLVIIAPLLYLLVWPDFRGFNLELNTFFFWSIVKTIVILWFGNTLARMFHILPQWQRLVLLRLGRSVGARGPGFFIVPPFIYSVACILDVRITDVGTPPSLIEELAVIARAERSAKAKKIQALLEISKEESAMVIVYPTSSLMGRQIASAAAGSQVRGRKKSVHKLDKVP